MAHQAHNIPWHLLANDLEYKEGIRNDRGPWTNLFPRLLPGQGERWNHFGRVFAKTILEHVTTERRKWPERYDRLNLDDILISDKTAKNIEPSVLRYRSDSGWHGSDFSSPPACPRHRRWSRNPSDPCNCGLSLEQRRGRYWLVIDDACYRNPTDTLELLNTLILQNEMEPILRLATRPHEIFIHRARAACFCTESRGWGVMMKEALQTYICLNILYCKPELWPSQQENLPRSSDVKDYRRTAGYQQMLIDCTYRNADSQKYYHRDFYGYTGDEFEGHPRFQKTTAVGLKSLGEVRAICQWHSIHSRDVPLPRAKFNERNIWESSYSKRHPNDLGPLPNTYVPHGNDIEEVLKILCEETSLPTELCLQVMKHANYERPRRQLPTQDDPLHPASSKELVEYLNQCWCVLVRCVMMAHEFEIEMEWDLNVMVADCIWDLWCCRGHNKWELFRYIYDIEPPRAWKEFDPYPPKINRKQQEDKAFLEEFKRMDKLRSKENAQRKRARLERKKAREEESQREKEYEAEKELRRLERRSL